MNETPTTQPNPAVPPTPLPGGRSVFTRFLIPVVAGLLLLAGIGGYLLWRSQQKAPEAAVVKKDIPIIKYGSNEGPMNSFYPAMDNGISERDINIQIFEGLVGYQGKTKIVPLLAASWTNPDDTTWVFTLKQGVKFHNGNTLTAKDVKYSLENFKDSPTGEIFNTTIKSVEVVDDYTVSIKTDGPDPILLNRLAALFIIDSSAEKPDDPANGTGAYTVKSGTKPTPEKLDLVAFDGYHGGHVYTRELQFLLFDSEASIVKALKDHTINLGPVDSEAAAAELKQAGFHTLFIDSLAVYHIGINHLKAGSPAQKLKVRQAIYHAVDPAALLKARKVIGEPASQLVTAEVPGFNPKITRPATDPAAAKRLLAEAGYPDGVTLEFTYYTKASADAAEELARQLKPAGITLRLDPIDDVPTIAEKVFGGGSELYFSSVSTDLLDAIDIFTDNFVENPNYNNPAVNELVTKASTTIDPAARLEMLQQISALLMDDVAWVPVYTPGLTWILDKPYVFQKDLPDQGINTYFWQMYEAGQ
jgi:peptide/nickel transport system substrate-binding protein